jgi:hypothetical protein
LPQLVFDASRCGLQIGTRPPHRLRSEGSGEDASVGSSQKQSSEIFLTEREDGRTELSS